MSDLDEALKRFAAWKHWRAQGNVMCESDELKDAMLLYEAYLELLALLDGAYL